jgi:nitrite reductase (NO-forming)
MEWQTRASTLIAGVILATACGPLAAERDTLIADPARAAAAQGAAAQQVTIKVGNSMHFDPAAFEVQAGQPIEIVLQNDGLLPHNFVLAQGVQTPVKIDARGGVTTSATFTLDRPGTYPFICSVPGHEAAGMRGTITAR